MKNAKIASVENMTLTEFLYNSFKRTAEKRTFYYSYKSYDSFYYVNADDDSCECVNFPERLWYKTVSVN